VIGGMLAATLVATFFIPLFYRLIAWRDRRTQPDTEAVPAFPQAEHP
jgi:multidrug efflux pump